MLLIKVPMLSASYFAIVVVEYSTITIIMLLPAHEVVFNFNKGLQTFSDIEVLHFFILQ